MCRSSLGERSGLPRNFGWLEESKVAGCARPETEAELKALKDQGIRTIISLTGTKLRPDVLQRLGFDYLHSHVSGAPSPEQLELIVEFIEGQKSQSRPVLVHCSEGKGRTGTVLAAYLVYNGMTANEAIRRVRELRPGSIESAEQEVAIAEYEKKIQKDRVSAQEGSKP